MFVNPDILLNNPIVYIPHIASNIKYGCKSMKNNPKIAITGKRVKKKFYPFFRRLS